ncbi:Gfo/Idh/MocA family oxidoreductase [Nonomuraea sp. NPDC047529]|uniref:Gfo/Idh/MocA family protein n=1 Tax=Nonomuraea sp. NPDC047529 TaxID=3155623 RepID=UPI0033EF7148
MCDSIKVGLVGVGVIAATHLEVLAKRSDIDLEFTVDSQRGEPAVFRGDKRPHFSTIDRALAAHQPDLIVIATPTDTHAEIAAQALRLSRARVLVEKPLAHNRESLARLLSLNASTNASVRMFIAHHFAFSPEVSWAVEKLSEHPEWGPVTDFTSAFYDPYVLLGKHAFDSYISSWMDSGVNQLSVLSRFIDLSTLTPRQQIDEGASSWFTYEHHSGATVGTVRLRTSWLTGDSSKKTALWCGHSGVEIWIDHTSMSGFATQGDELLAYFGTDGRTDRKTAHYVPLWESLLSSRPDPVIGFDVAIAITELHQA